MTFGCRRDSVKGALRPSLPVENDRFLLVFGVGDEHVVDAEPVNWCRTVVEENFHLQVSPGANVKVARYQLVALADRNTE